MSKDWVQKKKTAVTTTTSTCTSSMYSVALPPPPAPPPVVLPPPPVPQVSAILLPPPPAFLQSPVAGDQKTTPKSATPSPVRQTPPKTVVAPYPLPSISVPPHATTSQPFPFPAHYIYLNTAMPPPGYRLPIFAGHPSQMPVPHIVVPAPTTTTVAPTVAKPSPSSTPIAASSAPARKKSKYETGRNVFASPTNAAGRKLQTKLKHPFLLSKGMSPRKRKTNMQNNLDRRAWERSRDREPIPLRSRSKGRTDSPPQHIERRREQIVDVKRERSRDRRSSSRSNRRTPDRKRYSPHRRVKYSPARTKYSPEKARYSSERTRFTPERTKYAQETKTFPSKSNSNYYSPDQHRRYGRTPERTNRDRYSLDRDRVDDRYNAPSTSGRLNPPRRYNDDGPSPKIDKTQKFDRTKIRKVDNIDRVALGESDLEDVGQSDLSDTDDEMLVGRQNMPTSKHWAQCTPAGFYYRQDGACKVGTERSSDQRSRFHKQVLTRIREAKSVQPKLDPQEYSVFDVSHAKCRCCGGDASDSFSSSSSSDSDSDSTTEETNEGRGKEKLSKRQDESNQRFQKALEQLERKQNHPSRLHQELWFNEPGMMNDGPLCRCSWKSKQTGIRHSIFPGETKIDACDPNSNNLDRLHHYVVLISPLRNLCSGLRTTIGHDDHDYELTGFSLFTHKPLPEKLPLCRVMRWNIEYTLQVVKEDPPDAFTVSELEQFWEYFYDDLLEMYDISRWPYGLNEGCPTVHIMPRFTRPLPGNGREVLSMAHVLEYLLSQSKPLLLSDTLATASSMHYAPDEWDALVRKRKGQIVYNPNKRPCSIRVDQLDWRGTEAQNADCPVIIHFGVRPSVITYAGNPQYQKAWKQFVKYRHLMLMKGDLSPEDKQKLEAKEEELHNIKQKSRMKRDVTVEVPCQGFYATGLYPDSVMQGMMMLVIINHIRFHIALDEFEEKRVKYKFRNRALLELAFSHPSYRTNYGTNPDHARNTLSNCGTRQPLYGFQNFNRVNTRKRGINTLLDIMSKMGCKKSKESTVRNNERLEYLGDAVVEFLSTIHLFYMFPDLDEGGLATYRSALVQNKHLAVLAKKLDMDSFMLYAHGPDLCHEADLKHAMANAFEAVIGALFLDAGLEEVDRVFADALFPADAEYEQHYVWTHLHKHPLQEAEPNGDRHWIESARSLQKLTEFEDKTGIYFIHIRLLARAFTRRNVGFNLLTLGHNQRLEFLGDTVLQLITSEYLYKHFPEHHEGHLSLLRSCLVNNKTQSVICDDLGIPNFVINPTNKILPDLRMKDKADLVESFIGALYIDRGLEFCKTFCKVCFYPRLKYFILSQRWNDPKSQLQQCCLTLRKGDGGDPDIPVYKVIAVEGPTNTRVYKVAVYFRGKRMADAGGHSVQEAEMKAAEYALNRCSHIFPNLNKRGHNKRKAKSAYSPNKYAGQRIKGKYLHMQRSPVKKRQIEGGRERGRTIRYDT